MEEKRRKRRDERKGMEVWRGEEWGRHYEDDVRSVEGRNGEEEWRKWRNIGSGEGGKGKKGGAGGEGKRLFNEKNNGKDEGEMRWEEFGWKGEGGRR